MLVSGGMQCGAGPVNLVNDVSAVTFSFYAYYLHQGTDEHHLGPQQNGENQNLIGGRICFVEARGCRVVLLSRKCYKERKVIAGQEPAPIADTAISGLT